MAEIITLRGSKNAGRTPCPRQNFSSTSVLSGLLGPENLPRAVIIKEGRRRGEQAGSTLTHHISGKPSRLAMRPKPGHHRLRWQPV